MGTTAAAAAVKGCHLGLYQIRCHKAASAGRNRPWSSIPSRPLMSPGPVLYGALLKEPRFGVRDLSRSARSGRTRPFKFAQVFQAGVGEPQASDPDPSVWRGADPRHHASAVTTTLEPWRCFFSENQNYRALNGFGLSPSDRPLPLLRLCRRSPARAATRPWFLARCTERRADQPTKTGQRSTISSSFAQPWTSSGA